MSCAGYIYIGAEHLFSAVGFLSRFKVGFSVLFVMGYLSLLGYYGLRKVLDVVSNIVLKLGLRVVDRLVDGDAIFTPRGVGTTGGDASLPRSGVGSGVMVGGQMTTCSHCLVDVESQVYGESSLVAP